MLTRIPVFSRLSGKREDGRSCRPVKPGMLKRARFSSPACSCRRIPGRGEACLVEAGRGLWTRLPIPGKYVRCRESLASVAAGRPHTDSAGRLPGMDLREKRSPVPSRMLLIDRQPWRRPGRGMEMGESGVFNVKADFLYGFQIRLGTLNLLLFYNLLTCMGEKAI